MWIAIVETIGVIFVGGAAIIGIMRYFSNVDGRLKEHDVMLNEHETNQVKISDTLERTVIQVAQLEERTKNM